jgi:type IV pilus assembly protein PilP
MGACLGGVLLLLLSQSGGLGAAITTELVGSEAAALQVDVDIYQLLEIEQDTFVYKREGRSDPFMPFITDQAVSAKAVALQEPEEPEILTGLRKFEPGQLTVVAVIETPPGAYAMLEDSMRVGYVVREGTKIGRTGVIEQIEPNRVIIKLYSYTMAGDKRYQTVVMELKKEGEQ